MYTDTMKRSFTYLRQYCPPGFSVDIIDNNDFITIRMPTHKLEALSHDDKYKAVEYTLRVKSAFESLGAIVLVTRTPVDTQQ